MTKPEDILIEIEAWRSFLENDAKVTQDVQAMQNAMEVCMGYAERAATLKAEVLEHIAIRSNELMDQYIGNEDITDVVKKTKIAAAIAPDEKMRAVLAAIDRRLKDTKWLLMQAVGYRKEEMKKLM